MKKLNSRRNAVKGLRIDSYCIMNRILSIILLFIPLSAGATDNLVLQLDNMIKSAKTYDLAKEKRIASLRTLFGRTHHAFPKWKVCKDLYEEYKSYQCDSAYAYAEKGLLLAQKTGNTSTIVTSACDKVFCLLSAGLYKEASDEIAHIKAEHMDTNTAKTYYFTRWRLYADLSDYVHKQPYQRMYIKKAKIMADSVKQYVSKNSWQYSYMTALQQMKAGGSNQCGEVFRRLLRNKSINLHEKAIIASNLAWVYRHNGQDNQALHYFALSAIYDIRNSTKETTSAREAGAMLYNLADFSRAITYVQKALDDANFYGARQRMIEINNILPIIQRDRYENVARQRNTMIVTMTVISLFFIALCVSLFFLHRKVKELQSARKTISQRNKQLEESNKALQESNKINTEYIGRSFTINAEYINMMEKLFHTLDYKIMAKQYKDLSRSLQESKLNAQRKSMFADFDDAFLTIFPNFIEDFNALFAPENRKMPEGEQKLTTEMRIFALIRLGVKDSERIANFLHYSVNTINTYKTRVKNKSIVSNDEFEDRVMAIDA